MENFIERFHGHWTKYLVQFPFEWWISLTFQELIKSEFSKKKLNAWSRKLIKEERLQIAYFGVINKVNRIHLHLLVLGRNRFGKTLWDVSATKWEKAWKAQSKIQPIYDIIGISNYFERNAILKNDNLSEILLYNKKLLKKVKTSDNLIKLDDAKEWDFNKSLYAPSVDKKSVQSQMTELLKGFK